MSTLRRVASLFCVLAAGAGAAEAREQILLGADELRELAGDPGVVVLDVRRPAEFAREHLPGALGLPAAEGRLPAAAEIAARLGELGLDGSEEVVLYGEPGREAELGVSFLALESAGVAAVRILDGGLPAWRQRGGAVESGVPNPAAAPFVPARPRATTIEAEEVAALLAAEGVTLLDLRTGGSWQLYEPSPAYAAGHLPNALPYDFSVLVGDGGWPAVEAGRAELARLGPRPQTPVDLDSLFVLYGDDATDPRTALGYTLLRILGIDVRVYQGGWSGWTADGDRPVVRIVTARELRDLQERAGAPSAAGLYPRLPIFDLRELRDWEVGHVPGAFPLSDREFPRFLDLVTAAYWPHADRRQNPIVLYCYGPDCIRSRRGTAIALRHGWRNIYWFRDGIGGWFAAGLPQERVPEKTPWEPG